MTTSIIMTIRMEKTENELGGGDERDEEDGDELGG